VSKCILQYILNTVVHRHCKRRRDFS